MLCKCVAQQYEALTLSLFIFLFLLSANSFSLSLLVTDKTFLNMAWFAPFLQFFHFHTLFSSFGQNVNTNPRPTAQDLAGFWDLLQLSIEDISLKFDELYHLKSNDWQPMASAAAQTLPDRKVLPTPAAQCPGWGRKAAETGLSPPTTTTISPTFFLTSPFKLIPSLRGIDRGPPSPVQRGRRDPFRHAWRTSSQTGLSCCVFKSKALLWACMCHLLMQVLQWSMAKTHWLMWLNAVLLLLPLCLNAFSYVCVSLSLLCLVCDLSWCVRLDSCCCRVSCDLFIVLEVWSNVYINSRSHFMSCHVMFWKLSLMENVFLSVACFVSCMSFLCITRKH